MSQGEKIIEVVGLSYVYPDGFRALKDVSFTVYSDEGLGIIGPNGAGKSTLLLHLNGLLRGQGKIFVAGEEISSRNLKKIRSKIGLVFEDPRDQLFLPTIFDDLAFGLINQGKEEEEIKKRIQRVLNQLNLNGCEAKPARRLSAGERKKASLATVLVMEPEVLLLDEPTANLDPGGRKSFINILKSLSLTKIIATHDLDLVEQVCSRLILLANGVIVAQGRTREILNNKTLLQAFSLD